MGSRGIRRREYVAGITHDKIRRYTGRAKIYESIVKGEPASSAGVPESFNVLVQELRGLALDVSIWDSRGKRVPLTERDAELINRQGGQF